MEPTTTKILSKIRARQTNGTNKGLKNLFAELYQSYDLLNRVLTFGIDVFWRSAAARTASEKGGKLWLDICSGTGDMAIALKRNAPAGTKVIAVDFCLPMLRVGINKKKSEGIAFVIADAAKLPFREGVFDTATISFATRNLNTYKGNLPVCFNEFHRILKADGRFINLETSQPEQKPVRMLFYAYIKLIVKMVGTILSGSRAGYTYLSRTIPRFYSANELAAVLNICGFKRVHNTKKLFGIVAIHIADK